MNPSLYPSITYAPLHHSTYASIIVCPLPSHMHTSITVCIPPSRMHPSIIVCTHTLWTTPSLYAPLHCCMHPSISVCTHPSIQSSISISAYLYSYQLFSPCIHCLSVYPPITTSTHTSFSLLCIYPSIHPFTHLLFYQSLDPLNINFSVHLSLYSIYSLIHSYIPPYALLPFYPFINSSIYLPVHTSAHLYHPSFIPVYILHLSIFCMHAHIYACIHLHHPCVYPPMHSSTHTSTHP